MIAKMKTIHTAQEEFRQKDSDKNGAHDYWCQDVAGLYALSPEGKPLMFITEELAKADLRPAARLPWKEGPVPAVGYWVAALPFSDKKSDRNRFAVCAWPSEPMAGTWTFVMSHSGVIYGKECLPPLTYPENPSREGWVTPEQVYNLTRKRRDPLWWVRPWDY